MNMKQFLAKLIIASSLTGCANEFSFNDIDQSCEPPKSSARYGKNIGPIITFPGAGQPFNSSMTVSGTCADGFPVVISGRGVDAELSISCLDGKFSSPVQFKSGDGTRELDVAQEVVTGQNILDRRCFTQDSIPPKVAISSSNGAQAVNTNITNLHGICENGLSVIINGPQLTSPVTTQCVRGRFNTSIEFTGPDGLKDIEARQIDLAGNNGQDDSQFLTDRTPPIVTITSPNPLTLTQGNITITGTCEVGQRVILQGGILAGVASADCVSGTFSAPITLSSGDGTKQVIATQTDIAGNVGTATRDFIHDTTSPAIRFVTPAANFITTGPLTVTGTCEAGLSVQLSGAGLASPINTACSTGTFSQNINLTAPDGAKIIVATQTDAIGNIGTDTRTFVRDNAPPTITISSPAANSVWASALTLQGTCESSLTVQISGLGAASPTSTNCTNGTYSSLITLSNNDGIKNIVVAQTDTSGNTGSANRNFIRDSSSPLVSITSPSSNSYVTAAAILTGTCETGLNVILTGAGALSQVSTPCNSGLFSTNIQFSTGDGTKQIVATQTDAAGNSGSDSRSFIRDSSGPTITITSPSANTQAQTGVTLTGTCEAGLSVQLSGAGLASPNTTTCTSGSFSVAITFTNNDGTKNIIASQTDLSGNIGSDNRNFQRDSTAPAITITSPAVGTVAQSGLTVSGACESPLPVVLWGPGVSTAVTVNCTSGAYSGQILFTSGDGTKEVRASQTDLANNYATATRNFIRDGSGPAITITSPAANSYVGSSGTISGTCESGFDVTLSGVGTGVAGSVNASCVSGIFSAVVNFTSSNGTKTVLATQTDAAGNSGSDTRSFVHDGQNPTVTIASPAANSVHGSSLTLTGACETGLDVTLSGSGIASLAATPCTAGTYSSLLSLSLGDGTKAVTASQTDLSGNIGSASRNFIRDSTAPLISITTPAANTVARTSLTISGACESGISVILSGAGLASSGPSGSVSTNCTNGSFSSLVNLSSGDGSKNIIASQTDLAGNTGSDSRNFIRDNTAPIISITSPASGTISFGGVTLGGTCESGLTVTISGDVNSSSTTSCTNGTFSSAIVFSAALGTKNITTSQTDLAGNTGTSSRSFQKQNNGASESFTSQGPGGKVDILFVDDNSASMETEQTALGTKFSAFTTALSGLDWQAGIITTDCSSGSPHNYCGQLFDLTGRPANEYILSSFTPNYQSVFSSTIQRPETLDCLLNGTCPSGREEGMKSTIEAINRRDTDNAGFFRANSDLAVVFLSDEDEYSNGPANATQPSSVVSAVQSVWGAFKKFSVYGIIVQPGDTACYNSQRTQFGNNANYGNLISQLTALTGGMTASVCEPDYSITLTQIGNDVTRMSKSFDLANTPVAGTLTVSFAPAFSTSFSLSGRRVTLNAIPPTGTVITFNYQY